MKRKGSTQQIPFTGDPFGILGMKRLDGTHCVDRKKMKKNKKLEKEIKKV